MERERERERERETQSERETERERGRERHRGEAQRERERERERERDLILHLSRAWVRCWQVMKIWILRHYYNNHLPVCLSLNNTLPALHSIELHVLTYLMGPSMLWRRIRECLKPDIPCTLKIKLVLCTLKPFPKFQLDPYLRNRTCGTEVWST